MDAIVRGIFTGIYRENGFKGEESVSGTGSSMQATEQIRSLLPMVLAYCEAKTMLDIPCGDYCWMQTVPIRGILYTGADIVDSLVVVNQRQYGTLDRKFVSLDLLTDPLPCVDVVLCRDCLQHMGHLNALQAIANIKRSRSIYLLTTTYTDRNVNRDIPTGGWTAHNLKLPPFRFPQPILTINENCYDYYPGFTDKCLGLWRISRLP